MAGSRPGYLTINGGRPVYLCGPDNPEEFLFLGELNKDGTRSGPQQQIIDAIGKSGANAFHIMMFCTDGNTRHPRKHVRSVVV